MTMTVISLGWGVQSFTLAAMSALSELPPVDVAIHADTTHERAETYDFAREMLPWLEERGIRTVMVKAKKTRPVEHWGETLGIRIPAYTAWTDGGPSGMLGRQCNRDWKIAPIRRWLQANRNGERVETWLGISLDEEQRAKPANVQYIVNRWPLIELGYKRHHCISWLQSKGLPIPPRSSCVFCPFHDRATWREIKRSGNGDWSKAVIVDRGIRYKRPGYLCYLSPERIPIDEVDFRNEIDHGQLSFGFYHGP